MYIERSGFPRARPRDSWPPAGYPYMGPSRACFGRRVGQVGLACDLGHQLCEEVGRFCHLFCELEYSRVTNIPQILGYTIGAVCVDG